MILIFFSWSGKEKGNRFFFFFFGMEFLDMWVAAWDLFILFFLACDLSWNDELNFCFAKPQESR